MTIPPRTLARLRLGPPLALAIALTLAASGGASAQSAPADITVVSILTMAKDEAEKALDEEFRITLRNRVAVSMMKTGQLATFGSYAVDARNAYWSRDALDEIKKFNLEILAKAKEAFLGGDIEQTQKILSQCRLEAWPPPRCGSGEWSFIVGPFENMLFMGWEVEGGRLDAAFQRLKTMEWLPGFRAMALVGTGSYVVAGDRERIRELMQLAEAAGGKFDSCIMKGPIPWGPLPESPGTGAVIRKLACDGQVRSALDSALSQTNVGLRTSALLIVAEGLAGIPGLSIEQLEYY